MRFGAAAKRRTTVYALNLTMQLAVANAWRMVCDLNGVGLAHAQLGRLGNDWRTGRDHRRVVVSIAGHSADREAAAHQGRAAKRPLDGDARERKRVKYSSFEAWRFPEVPMQRGNIL